MSRPAGSPFRLPGALDLGCCRRCGALVVFPAGEGSGKALDLDRFDDYDIHLLAWDAASRQIIGACRLGLMDDIMSRYGKRGLYTYTLFDYPTAFLGRIGPAIECSDSTSTGNSRIVSMPGSCPICRRRQHVRPHATWASPGPVWVTTCKPPVDVRVESRVTARVYLARFTAPIHAPPVSAPRVAWPRADRTGIADVVLSTWHLRLRKAPRCDTHRQV